METETSIKQAAPPTFFELPRARRRKLIRQYHGTLARIGRRMRISRAYVSQIALRRQPNDGPRAERIRTAIEAEFGPWINRKRGA